MCLSYLDYVTLSTPAAKLFGRLPCAHSASPGAIPTIFARIAGSASCRVSKSLDAILARLPDAKKSGIHWRARCPAHADSTPSLQIGEGARGVLLRCWAGCELREIAAALQIKLTDLFDDANTPRPVAVRESKPVGAAEIEAAVASHLRRILDAEVKRLGYEPPTTLKHVNTARMAAGRVLGVVLSPVRPEWWESATPHEDDPLWPIYCERALQEITRERHGLDADISAASQVERDDAMLRAASWIRAEAKCSCGKCSQCRARVRCEAIQRDIDARKGPVNFLPSRQPSLQGLAACRQDLWVTIAPGRRVD